MPKFVNSNMINQMNKTFPPEFHFEISSIQEDKGSKSVVELISQFDDSQKGASQARIVPSIEQLDYLFDRPLLIQNPLETYKTMSMHVFRPSIAKRFVVFLYEFKVEFMDTLVNINIHLDGSDEHLDIKTLPMSYMIGKQFKQ